MQTTEVKVQIHPVAFARWRKMWPSYELSFWTTISFLAKVEIV